MAVPAQRLRRMGGSLTANPDVALSICVIGILLVLILPIAPWAIDVLLTINISLSVVVLLATIYLRRPVEFNVFPSLLLMLTLYRLSLNVATTRIILAEAYGGTVVAAFGSFVTKGNIYVGIVIFVILVVIQFVVITKGATRISEVAARFTLDAMPGKQMGVDSDLNAGLITEQQARARRRDIEREADFYGAMDGATKFVRGDAIAGIVITVVNIVVGLIIGSTMHGMTLAQAAAVYTQLTIGDGLVSQVPSLIISIAAGLVVTRSVSEDNLGSDLTAQALRYPRALGIASAMLLVFAVVPGMPTLPFIIVSLALGVTAYTAAQVQTRYAAEAEAEEAAMEEARREEAPERTEDLLSVDPLKIELGYGLIVLADPNQGGDPYAHPDHSPADCHAHGLHRSRHSHRGQHAPGAQRVRGEAARIHHRLLHPLSRSLPRHEPRLGRRGDPGHTHAGARFRPASGLGIEGEPGPGRTPRLHHCRTDSRTGHAPDRTDLRPR